MKINWKDVILSIIYDIFAVGFIYVGIDTLNKSKFLAIIFFLCAIRNAIRSYLLTNKDAK